MRSMLHGFLRLFGVDAFMAGAARSWLVESTRHARIGLPQERLSDAAFWEHVSYLMNRLKVDAVLDVGANVGQFADGLRKVGYAGRIASFEPNPDLVRMLEAKAARDRLWSIHGVGIGDRNGECVLNVAVGSTLSSFCATSAYGSERFGRRIQLEKQVSVPVRRLDEMLAGELADLAGRRLFVKIDTQGFDMQAFRGLGTELSRVVLLQSELSFRALYKGTHNYVDTLTALEASGLRPAFLHPVCTDPRSFAAVEMDCLFVPVGTASANATTLEVLRNGA